MKIKNGLWSRFCLIRPKVLQSSKRVVMKKKLSQIKALLFMIVSELEKLEVNLPNAPPAVTAEVKKNAHVKLKVIKGGKD